MMGEVGWLMRMCWFFQNWAASFNCRKHRRCTDQTRRTWPFQCVGCPMNEDEFDSANGFDAEEEETT